MNAPNADTNGNRMSKFKIKSRKIDNSFLNVKIAIRKWLLQYIQHPFVLDVYGPNGAMFLNIWKSKSEKYRGSIGDSIQWLLLQNSFDENVFDIDPYASPFEAIEIICKKSTQQKIGIVCTDGVLRRVAMMRTKLPDFIQKKCNLPERNLALMAAIYYQYPSFLRHIIKKIAPNYIIDRLVIKYGEGTWKQALVYFAVILNSYKNKEL